MARYQVILAYDGTRFQGFQRQAGQPEALTIQGAVEAALRPLGWDGQAILAAGRTDAGVHASGQVIAFDLEWNHSTQGLISALNARLPDDVVAQAVQEAEPDFHPRYAALARRYRYRIYCREVPDPLKERYAWRVWPAVSLEPMRRAASYLAGKHDFAAFGTPPRTGGSTVRSVFAADWSPASGVQGNGAPDDGGDLTFEITGDAFLYRMVRRLVYQLVAVGQGKQAAEQILSYLGSPPPFPVQGLAPPQGLVLAEVVYAPGRSADQPGKQFE